MTTSTTDLAPRPWRGLLRPALAAAVVAALLVALLTVTGGGDAGIAEAAGPPADPCELLTEAEAAEALGSPVLKQRSGPMCAYMATAPHQDIALSIGLMDAPEDPALFGEMVAEYAKLVGVEPRPVDGVGSEAWSVLGDQVAQLDVLAGQYHLIVLLLPSPMDDAPEDGRREATLRDLGTRAVGRLS